MTQFPCFTSFMLHNGDPFFHLNDVLNSNFIRERQAHQVCISLDPQVLEYN